MTTGPRPYPATAAITGQAEVASAAGAAEVRKKVPRVADHELVRCIGQGSYGEVWLGRNALGDWRAIKLIYRRNFEHDRPFEREFEGIRKFDPISRQHPSQLQVLHVGRNDTEGCFYYVMELLPGMSLDELVAHHGPLPPERAVHFLREHPQAPGGEVLRDERAAIRPAAPEREIEAEAEAQYSQAVLLALQDVETSLARYRASRARVDRIQDAASASERAEGLARIRFTEGVADFLQVLDAERTLLDAQSQLSQARTDAATAYASLYKALGGTLPGGGS